MLHEMKLKSEEFKNIKYNNKIIEVRLNDKKRRKISEGDKIIFYKLPQLSESILVKIKKIYNFSTFKELYKELSFTYFGYGNLNMSEILSRIYSIYSATDEKKNGVIAIMFQIDNEEKFHE